MRILMISIGNDILCEGSSTQMRHLEYGKICDELCIIVLHTKPHETEHETTRSAIVAKGGIDNNVWIYAAGGKNKISSFFNACKLAGRIMREKKIDLITTQDVAYTGLIGYGLKKKFRVKLNAQIHGLEEKLLNKILFFSLKKKIIRGADSIRVVSERMKKWVMEKYGVEEKKIFKIPIYVKLESGIMNNELGINNEAKGDCCRTDFTILTVSRLVKVKNIDLQIEAMLNVIKIFPNVKLIIAGDGPEKKYLHKLAENLKLKDKVEFAGWVENVASFYRNADLFLLTSNNEGWGLAVIEAMASGLPVIMTNVGCAGEVLRNEENGLVIPTNDKKALISAISEMIADKRKRKLFAKKGMEAVKKLPNKTETLEMYAKMWNL